MDAVQPLRNGIDMDFADSGVAGALPERVRGEVARVDAPGPTEISLNLHDGREIYFGSSDRASEKGRAAEIVMDREGQRWNVSNPVAPSVRN